MSDFSNRRSFPLPASKALRMWRAVIGQSAASPICPPEPRLDGRVALVTGGGRGIGLETSRGLLARGAETIAASRSGGDASIAQMKGKFDAAAHFVPVDLADLGTIEPALDALEHVLGPRRLDILIANAGLWPRRHARSAQGYELAFATNVLGHHALIRGLQRRGRLADGARIVVLTGDIYILASDCTPDFSFRGPRGGRMAYCRSKLGSIWLASELARRRPDLSVYVVHPGVIASGLGGGGEWLTRIKSRVMLSPARGAQTSLFCATQPGLPSGAYYHNVFGRMDLAAEDPAADARRARAFFDEIEAICERHEGAVA